MAIVKCTRCGESRDGLAFPPFRAGTRLADLGVQVQENICKPCWDEWIGMSVKLVNETRMDTTDPRGQALQRAFVEHGAVQCGFCTPGMVMQAAELLARDAHPDAAAAKRAIEGNLCRCTGYQKIVGGICAAAQALDKEHAR